METLTKGELDWHNKVNANFNELDTKKIGIENLIASTSYGVVEGLTVTAQSTPNMSVNAASGKVDMLNGIELTPTGNNNLAIDAANSTDARIDIVYISQDGTVGYTAGTPSSTPVVPSIPQGAFLLYEINVMANATAITNDNLIDKRKMKFTIDDVAGVGRTTETIKKNADDIKTLGTQMAEKANLVDVNNGFDIRPTILSSSQTYYVDAATGDDSVGDGTQTKPFKTISKIFSILGKYIIDSTVTVNLNGTFSNEGALTLGTRGSGILTFTGGTINSYIIIKQSYISLSFNTVTFSASGSNILNESSNYVIFLNCTFHTDHSGQYDIGITTMHGGKSEISGCSFDGYTFVAIESKTLGINNVFSATISNVTGHTIQAEEQGKAIVHTSAVSGTTLSQTGGVIETW